MGKLGERPNNGCFGRGNKWSPAMWGGASSRIQVIAAKATASQPSVGFSVSVEEEVDIEIITGVQSPAGRDIIRRKWLSMSREKDPRPFITPAAAVDKTCVPGRHFATCSRSIGGSRIACPSRPVLKASELQQKSELSIQL